MSSRSARRSLPSEREARDAMGVPLRGQGGETPLIARRSSVPESRSGAAISDRRGVARPIHRFASKRPRGMPPGVPLRGLLYLKRGPPQNLSSTSLPRPAAEVSIHEAASGQDFHPGRTSIRLPPRPLPPPISSPCAGRPVRPATCPARGHTPPIRAKRPDFLDGSGPPRASSRAAGQEGSRPVFTRGLA
jgi:hypothetical protein